MSVSPLRILFVCFGNICRSPTAECVLRSRISSLLPDIELQFDSAGTSGMHAGKLPDRRTMQAGEMRGYAIDSIARQFRKEDVDKFDLILAMDRDNLEHIERLCGKASHVRLFSFLLNETWPTDVPDPYYGGVEGFEYVLDMVEAGTGSLIEWIRSRSALPDQEN